MKCLLLAVCLLPLAAQGMFLDVDRPDLVRIDRRTGIAYDPTDTPDRMMMMNMNSNMNMNPGFNQPTNFVTPFQRVNIFRPGSMLSRFPSRVSGLAPIGGLGGLGVGGLGGLGGLGGNVMLSL